MKRTTKDIAEYLIQKYDLERVSFNDFLNACEYSFEELKSKSRERELIDWRNVGILIAYKESRVLSRAGKVFNRDHSTVLHSIKELDKEYPTVIENIRCVQYYAKFRKHYCKAIQVNKVSFEPINVNINWSKREIKTQFNRV